MRLDLSTYLVPETYCRANRDNFDSTVDRDPVVKTTVSHIYSEEDNDITVVLNISNRSSITEEDPYEFEIEIFGCFKLEMEDAEGPADVEAQYSALVINCAKILYSGARDYLHTISGKGPYGAIKLPPSYFTRKGIEFNKQESQDNN